ncbi:hypothetical protein BDU57DRAFT_508854 [Ampelomyces quisqualis]|uniref:Uncharacterized protein n=1 Tax=Ampelomyces quisqualis TaxID=50730 RepID=A0A6A5QXK6_AMPQU|nr:hypothetical protein BDU57DRAFT_508854 [Ampelomyces quisqualis]
MTLVTILPGGLFSSPLRTRQSAGSASSQPPCPVSGFSSKCPCLEPIHSSHAQTSHRPDETSPWPPQQKTASCPLPIITDCQLCTACRLRCRSDKLTSAHFSAMRHVTSPAS